MKRYHIAHFTNTYHPVVNGVVRSVGAFKKALTEIGHNAFVFTHQGDYEDDEPFVFRYPSLDLPISVDIPAVIPVSLLVDAVLPILKLDVIHSHHPVLLGEAAADKARKHKLPLVFTFHSQYEEYSHYFPLPQQAVQKFIKEMIQEWMFEYVQKCHHIVIPSEGMRKMVVEEYGLESGYSVIPTGIDLEPYQNLDDGLIRRKLGWGNQKVIIGVGRLAKEKNWLTLLDACALAMAHRPDLRLVLLGDGPERSALEKHTRSLGIAQRVDFLGKIPLSEVPQYLAAADCFGFASLAETQGLVTLEALAAGLPVAAVAATGTSDIVIDSRQGFLTPNDSRALSQAFLKIFENPDQLAVFKAAALQQAKKFSIEAQARRLIEVYEQAIAAQQCGQYVRIAESRKKERKFAGLNLDWQRD